MWVTGTKAQGVAKQSFYQILFTAVNKFQTLKFMYLGEATPKHPFILSYLPQRFQLVQYLLLTQGWRIRWSEMLKNKTKH